MEDKSYSYNEEEYHSNYADILDHFNDHYNAGDKVEYWVGDTVKCGHERYLDSSALIDDMQERAYDELGEFTSNYLSSVTARQREEIKDLVVDYLNKNITPHTFFAVENVKKVEGLWDGEYVRPIKQERS